MEFLVVILLFVVLCKVDHITSTNTLDDRHPGFLFHIHPGYIFSLPANTKVKQKSTKVSSEMDCAFACVRGTTWCRSANFKIAAEKDGRHICELIATEDYTNPKHLKQDEKFTHLNIKNPCEGNPCLNEGKCIPHGNRQDYRCKCKKGYTGNDCQNDVDECMGSPGCHSDAICVNSPGSFRCVCKPGFVGNGKNCRVMRDCSDIYKTGERRSGVYTIKPDSQGTFQVYCDMTTDGGGWTVFQRRQDGSVDFYLGWQLYKAGFGNPNGEFWLGNDYIHRLTARTPWTLRVELEDWAGTRKYAKYGSFSVNAESDNYRLSVGSYSGTAGDSLVVHNNMLFSTKDRDNDAKSGENCATSYTGAWWYNRCYASNLNGRYFGNVDDVRGNIWYYFHKRLSLKFTEMKMRPQIILS